MPTYQDDDVIITEYEEVFFYWEAKKYKFEILRLANEEEAIEFLKEYRYQEQVKSENESAGSFHELK